MAGSMYALCLFSVLMLSGYSISQEPTPGDGKGNTDLAVFMAVTALMLLAIIACVGACCLCLYTLKSRKAYESYLFQSLNYMQRPNISSSELHVPSTLCMIAGKELAESEHSDWSHPAVLHNTTCLQLEERISQDSGYHSHSSSSTDNVSTSSSESHLKALKIEDSKLYELKVGTFDFMQPIGIFKCGASGGIYNNSRHNFTIVIPAGAVPNDSVLSIEIGVCLYGPFSFPDNQRPVSVVLWLHAQKHKAFQFQKAVKVTLQHYIDVSEEEDCHLFGLTFMKANCRADGRVNFEFVPAQGRYNFPVESDCGTLYTTCFCFACITAHITPEIFPKFKYSLLTIEPRLTSDVCWSIRFVICYCLKTCVQTVQQQYTDQDISDPTPFTFKEPTDAQSIPCLRIDFQRSLREGWLLALKSGYHQITAREVDFWSIIKEYSEKHLQMQEDLHLYPPRYSVQYLKKDVYAPLPASLTQCGSDVDNIPRIVVGVNGQSASTGATATFHFSGAAEGELISEISLPFVDQSQRSSPGGRPGALSLPCPAPTRSSLAPTLCQIMNCRPVPPRSITAGVHSPNDSIEHLYYSATFTEASTHEASDVWQHEQNQGLTVANTFRMPPPLMPAQYSAPPPLPPRCSGNCPNSCSSRPGISPTTVPSQVVALCNDVPSYLGQKRPATPDDLTDEELEEVSKEIMSKLGPDWTKLKAYLGVPDYIMTAITNLQFRPTVRGQVMQLLKEWKNLQKDTSCLHGALAEILSKADPRLHKAVKLLSKKDHHIWF